MSHFVESTLINIPDFYMSFDTYAECHTACLCPQQKQKDDSCTAISAETTTKRVPLSMISQCDAML